MIGIAASIFAATALTPYLVSVIRRRKKGNGSVVMPGILFAGLALWTYYGLLRGDWIVVMSNTLCMLADAFILYGALRFRVRSPAQPETARSHDARAKWRTRQPVAIT